MSSQITLTDELRKAVNAVYLACEEDVAQDISSKLQRSANKIESLRDVLKKIKRMGTATLKIQKICEEALHD